MLYQKLLMGSKPYQIVINRLDSFEMHRHPEIEFLYCLEGECRLLMNRKRIHLAAGELAIAGSMQPHEILPNVHCRAMVIEVGPVLLGEYFESLAKLNLSDTLFSPETNAELFSLMEETAAVFEQDQPFAELQARGNIYKICACLLRQLMESAPSSATKSLVSISKIEKVLELVENSFDEPLDIDRVASLCGYSKSNFCRIFKQITGDTFHAVLTRRRVQAAQLLLTQTAASVEGVALQTGFMDAKSLCRAFRRQTGMSPGAFRKQKG